MRVMERELKVTRNSAEATSIKLLLEAGAHFGHETSRWHPRMKKYIFTQRNGIHIIDLEQTVALLEKACSFVRETIAKGEDVLFVGTKRQVQEIVEQEAKRCGMPFVNQRWIGGMLTNFNVIQSRIDYLVRLEDQKSRGDFDILPKKEVLRVEKKVQRLNRQMGGFKEMTKLPGALFITDLSKESIAVAEARRIGVPSVAIVDTDCNPDVVDYLIPANDDAIRAVRLICSKIAEAVLEGKASREGAEEEMLEGGEAAEALGVLTFTPEEDQGGDSEDLSNDGKGSER
jgi:small subunit ribosomal protein S2